MGERIYKGCEKVFEAKKFENLKEMITNTKKEFGNEIAFKFKEDDSEKINTM